MPASMPARLQTNLKCFKILKVEPVREVLSVFQTLAGTRMPALRLTVPIAPNLAKNTRYMVERIVILNFFVTKLRVVVF